jgi:hypothetical protein
MGSILNAAADGFLQFCETMGFHFTLLIVTISMDNIQDTQGWETLVVQPLLK